MSKSFLKNEIKNLITEVRKLDRKVVIIIISVLVFQTISWYFTSRRFFNLNLYDTFKSYQRTDLIEFYYWFIGDFISLFFLPFLVIKFYFKEKPADYGLSKGDVKPGLKISGIFFLVMLPVLWIVSSSQPFIYVYPMMQTARESWILFLIYGAGLLLYVFAWEFIWRGYMMFGLKEKFGYYAIFIQTIPFVILHNGKPAAETFGAIVAGIALGFLAFRTGSVIYGVIIHWGVMISIDFISVLRFRTGEYGAGLSSLINIIKNL